MHHIGNSKNVRQWPEQHWQSVVGHISVYILLQADPQFLLESNSVVRERRRVTKTNANQKTKVYLHIKHSVRHWDVGS